MAAELVELGLGGAFVHRRTEALRALGDSLLGLMATHAPDDAALKTEAFRAQVDEWREALRVADDPERLASLSRRVVEECDVFLGRVRGHRADREAEIVELVNVLRTMAETIRGEVLEFEHAMDRSTAAMGRIGEIEDIRELKRALTREVHAIRDAVAERKALDARRYETLVTRVETLETTLVKATTEAATDALTRLPNRGAFDVAVREWVRRAERDGTPFAVAMVDLDDFKRINDTHGHPVGDRVIKAAAELLRSGVGDGEMVARFGGEEFAALLATPSLRQARERLTALLSELPPAYEYDRHGERCLVTFTFSAGVTEFVQGDSPDAMVRRADEGLYDAKRKGKNRVETRTRSFLRSLIGS